MVLVVNRFRLLNRIFIHTTDDLDPVNPTGQIFSLSGLLYEGRDKNYNNIIIKPVNIGIWFEDDAEEAKSIEIYITPKIASVSQNNHPIYTNAAFTGQTLNLFSPQDFNFSIGVYLHFDRNLTAMDESRFSIIFPAQTITKTGWEIFVEFEILNE